MVLSGVESEPQKSDAIEIEVGTETLVYEVLSVPGEQGWQGDPHRKMWRVHTKRVK
jgi:hypothetical protein